MGLHSAIILMGGPSVHARIISAPPKVKFSYLQSDRAATSPDLA